MFGRSKRKSQAASTGAPQVTTTNTTSGGYQPAELQVFDGKGHRAVMVFQSDNRGRIVQRLRKGRDFKAHLPHVHH